MIESAKEKVIHLNDIITVAKFLRGINLEGLHYNLFQVRSLHATAMAIKREFASEDAKYLLENFGDKEIAELTQLFINLDKYNAEDDNLAIKMEDDFQKILIYVKDELRLSNPMRFLTAQAISLMANIDYIEIIDGMTYKGFSDKIATLIVSYQADLLINDLEPLLDEETITDLMEKNYNSLKVKELVKEFLILINSRFGYDPETEIDSMMQGLLFYLEQNSEHEMLHFINLLWDAINKIKEEHDDE